MEEAIWERIEKQNEPSERQKTYIVALAKAVGLKVDVSTITNKQKASVFIERLKILSRRMNRNNEQLRDKKVAFGMVTKLMFRTYCEERKDPMKVKGFWKDVNKLYENYQEQQLLAINGKGVMKDDIQNI